VAYPPPPIAADLSPEINIESTVDVQGTLDTGQEQTP
jgi:hypothetical protein